MTTVQTETSPNTLRWMLVVSTLLLLLGVPGSIAGLVLAAMVLFVVSQRSDLPQPIWYALAALPVLLHLGVLALLVLKGVGILDD